MGDPNQKIIVVEREKLFDQGKYFQGFVESDNFDYEKRILDNVLIMRRGSTQEAKDHPDGNAELDTRFKQPIGYMMIVNPYSQKIYAFKRASKDEHYTDRRLQGKWSWGVGGHIEPLDVGTENRNPLTESRLRELEEEVIINGMIKKVRPLGYINDDRDSIGSVHFGVLYLIEIDGTAKPKDKEMEHGEMLSISDLESLSNSQGVEVESWSRIALEPLKTFFSDKI